MLDLSKKLDARWVTITEKGGDLDLLVRGPTFEELQRDLAAPGESRLEGLFDLVTDWKGVTNAGEPVAFSAQALAEFFQAFPQFYRPAVLALHEVMLGGQVEKEEEKN